MPRRALLVAAILLFPIASLPLSAQQLLGGDYDGSVTVRGEQVPIHLRLSGAGTTLSGALVNGPELSPASSVSLSGNHLVLNFNYFARTLDLNLAPGGSPVGNMTGSFGTPTTRYPVSLHHSPTSPPAPISTSAPPPITGQWEIQVQSPKGESAWQLGVQPAGTDGSVQAVIQRIDGDTGSLFGSWNGHEYRVGHLSAAGPALYSLTPGPDDTLLVSNLIAAEPEKSRQHNLVARRPAAARAQNLPQPTRPTEQTTIKNPSEPFRFSAPDLAGSLVTERDPRFDGKVLIVAIGGSWCPNCHDEAPFLESLYKQFHSRGLEVVDLSFEEADQLKDPSRLRAFIARYGITYTVLLAGEPDQLNQKLPEAEHLNSWPTSFFLGRDGRVREVHAGFAGPANPTAHQALVTDTTALVEQLLAEPAPTHAASVTSH